MKYINNTDLEYLSFLGGEGEDFMNINFKFLTFCLITMLLVASYRTATQATTAPRSRTTAASKSRTTSSRSSLVRQGNIQVPTAGSSWQIKDLFALINKNNPQQNSNFIITDNTGENSYSAGNVGFDANWAKNNTTSVKLFRDEFQVRKLISRGVLPSPAVLNSLRGNASKSQTYQLFKHISDNFPKIMLYFEAVSPTDNKAYKLYIADPCPGRTNWTMVIQGRLNPQTSIPAYTNVLSKWKVN
ncbi:MAG: hypothetical protein US22_C0026G0008 [candidate division TM6 bacterium GW2011_GWF2_36_6]|nr:MAG: hypothetical protein US22_C0026G0008 [candidate division TM6 bacterium GW2011_GWF2_36_6]